MSVPPPLHIRPAHRRFRSDLYLSQYSRGRGASSAARDRCITPLEGGPRNWVRYCDTVAAPPPEGEPGVAFGSDLRRISLSPRHTHESAPQGDIRSLLRVSVSTATVVGSSCTLA